MQHHYVYDKHSFKFLNATQFLGALNDNVFKLLIIYLLINVHGINNAPLILAMAGAVFVIPFLLFSSAAGVLADRISKRSILVSMKISEIVIMVLSLFAIYFRSDIALYSLLFLMATQSAAFGPSKYGIIPEIVEPKYVSRANGFLTSLTFLAIILGTFLASFITDVSNKNFMLVGISCVVISLFGFVSSVGIKKTPPKGSKKRINPFFLYEIHKSLLIASKKKYLLPSVFGSAFFLFMGGFTQLNAIPFAIQTLGLNEVGGGYLFLTTAIGIAIGSTLAGKISRDRVEPGLACCSGFFLGIILILLGLFAKTLTVAIILFILLGFCGGFFIVPFDAFIQVSSPDRKRGRIIAASNFLSFLGVLIASFMLYLIGGNLRFTSATGFILVGLITLVFNVIITGRMSEPFFSYITRKILLKHYKVKVNNIPSSTTYIVLINGSWLYAILLYSFLPNLKIFRSGHQFKQFPFVSGIFNSIHLTRKIKTKNCSLKKMFSKVNKIKRRINFACLFLDKEYTEKDLKAFLKTSYGQHYTKQISYLDVTRKGKRINFNFSTQKNQKA